MGSWMMRLDIRTAFCSQQHREGQARWDRAKCRGLHGLRAAAKRNGARGARRREETPRWVPDRRPGARV